MKIKKINEFNDEKTSFMNDASIKIDDKLKECLKNIQDLIMNNEDVQLEIDDDGWIRGSGIGFNINNKIYQINIQISNQDNIDILKNN